MNRGPEISVVFTVRDAAPFIRRSLQAALAMDHDSFEVLVVNDGSADDTMTIVHGFADSRIRTFDADRPGRGHALNFAIARARGRYIAINDADDISLPHRLSGPHDYLDQHEACVLVAVDFERSEQFGAPHAALRRAGAVEFQPLSNWRLYRNNPLAHSAVMFRKSAWERIGGYDEALPMCIDYDFFLRLAPLGELARSTEVAVVVYANPGSHFKQFPKRRYLATSLGIRNRTRSALGLPPWARLLSVVQLIQVMRISLAGWLKSLRP